MIKNQSFSSSVSYPAPPDGYRYMLDGQGNQTTVLSKIGAEGTMSNNFSIAPSQYVSFSELSPSLSTATGNLSMATDALSSVSKFSPTSLVSSTVTEASDLVKGAWGKIETINASSPTADASSLLGSAKEMLGTAMTKLNSIGEFVSGQVSGLITSAKSAITAAMTAVSDGISKIADAGKKLVSAGIDKVKAMAMPADVQGPNFKDTMDSIKNGSVMKDISASLSKVSEVAGSLPTSVAGGLATAQAAIAAKMASLQQNIGTEMALAKANQELLTKETIAATGSPPTQEQLDAAAGNVAIFKDGPKFLAEQAKSIATSVAGFASSFGAKVGNALGIVKDGAETGAATAVGAKVTEFANSIPAETIPDPENPGQTIPNPAYTAFASANADKMSAVTSLTNAVQNASAGMTAGFTSLTSAADSAKSSIITNLKASALAGQISAKASGMVADVKNQTIDMSKVDNLNMAKTSSQVATAAAAAAAQEGANTTSQTNASASPALKSTDSTAVPTSSNQDRVFKVEVFDYHKEYVEANKDLVKEYKAKLEATPEFLANVPNRDAFNKLKASKPDESTWTDDDKALAERYKATKAAGMATDAYITYRKYYDLYSKEIDNYNNYVYKAWEQNLSRSTIPAEIRSRLSVQSAYESVHGKTG